MAIQYVHTIPDGTIIVKWQDGSIVQEIHVQDTISNLVVQDLLNACRAAEASLAGFAFPTIAAASGKEILGSGVTVGITLQLLGGWRVYSTKASGVFTILGGNLVKGDGSSPFRPNNLITYVNVLSASSTIVSTSGGGSGGGFTDSDRTRLVEIHNGSAPLVPAIFATIIDGTITFGAFMKKWMAIVRGRGIFTKPVSGTNRFEYQNQAGTVEETHDITSTGRTVS